MPRNGFHISHASWQIIFASYAFHSCLGDGKIFFPWPFKVWLLLPLWKLNWKPGSWWQFLETLANLHTETLHQWETPTGPHYNSNTDIWKILKNFFFLIIVGNWGSWGFLNNFFCSQPRTETAATKFQRISQKYLNGKRRLLQTPSRSSPNLQTIPTVPWESQWITTHLNIIKCHSQEQLLIFFHQKSRITLGRCPTGTTPNLQWVAWSLYVTFLTVLQSGNSYVTPASFLGAHSS